VRDNFQRALGLMLEHEGGFVHHPRDPGGMTNLGVTKSVYELWKGRSVSEAEMRALTIDDVSPIYHAKYWTKVRGDDLPLGVDYAVFDFAVNSGVRRAARTLQQLVGVHDDGVIGPFTIGATKTLDANDLIEDLCNARMVFLRGLGHWDTFGRGWTRRVNEVEHAAKAMTGS
jgi:lysozyme family protein